MARHTRGARTPSERGQRSEPLLFSCSETRDDGSSPRCQVLQPTVTRCWKQNQIAAQIERQPNHSMRYWCFPLEDMDWTGTPPEATDRHVFILLMMLSVVGEGRSSSSLTTLASLTHTTILDLYASQLKSLEPPSNVYFMSYPVDV